MSENFPKIQKRDRNPDPGDKNTIFYFPDPKQVIFQLPVVSYIAFTPRLDLFLKFVVN
jgi:hypothetical protein